MRVLRFVFGAFDIVQAIMTLDIVLGILGLVVGGSGNRAGIAKGQLQSAGYTKEIENLGPWQNVTCKTK